MNWSIASSISHAQTWSCWLASGALCVIFLQVTEKCTERMLSKNDAQTPAIRDCFFTGDGKVYEANDIKKKKKKQTPTGSVLAVVDIASIAVY